MRSSTKTSRSPTGAVLFPTFNVGGYHWAIFANSGFFDVKKKLRDYTKSEWDKFLYLDDPKVKVKSLGKPEEPLRRTHRQIQAALSRLCGEMWSKLGMWS